MYKISELKQKALDAGYEISRKGFSHYHYNNAIVEYGGERMTGYNVTDLSNGYLVWGSYDNVRDHVWQLEDVQEFLKSVYEDAGLDF